MTLDSFIPEALYEPTGSVKTAFTLEEDPSVTTADRKCGRNKIGFWVILCLILTAALIFLILFFLYCHNSQNCQTDCPGLKVKIAHELEDKLRNKITRDLEGKFEEMVILHQKTDLQMARLKYLEVLSRLSVFKSKRSYRSALYYSIIPDNNAQGSEFKILETRVTFDRVPLTFFKNMKELRI